MRLSPKKISLPFLAFSLTLSPLFAQKGDRKDSADMVQREIWKEFEVPEAPVLSPEESLATIKVASGFRLELVAAEPLINDPVAITWDADGRLYAVEMRGYMPNVDGVGEEEPVGRIVVLEDLDQDGRMDKSTVFLDGLVQPRSVAIVKGGVLVAAPPSLYFCEDLDGDLVSDRKTKIADYAARGSVEHMENAMLRGMDNWLYNAKSSRRMKWDGQTIVFEETEFRGQWGLSMDDYGRLFYTTNSNPLIADFQPYQYANRNPGHTSEAGLQISIASTRDYFANRVTPGINRAYREGQLRPDHRMKTVTAISGPGVYRGNKYPQEYYGNVFSTEPSGNGVIRFQVVEEGFGLKALKKVEDDPVWDKIEFISSTDERFRPVNAATGPDGFLYIVDLYRGIIQHKEFVTTFLRKQIIERGLDNPVGLGRIYRLVHEDSPEDYKTPQLSRFTDLELANALQSDNGWIRDTAQRLLVERDSISSAALEALGQLSNSQDELASIHALWALEGREQLNAITLAAALRNSSPWVRVHALRAGEKIIGRSDGPTELFRTYENLFDDNEFRVRLQAIQSLSAVKDTDFVISKIKSVFHPDLPNEYMEDAIVSSLSGREISFIKAASSDPNWIALNGRQNYLEKLGAALFAKGDTPAILKLASKIKNAETPNWTHTHLIKGLGAGASADGARPIKLPEEPKAFTKFASSQPSQVAEVLDKVFRWPGKASDSILDTLSPKQLASIERGKNIYNATCFACHQADGNGMANLGPPLNKSEWVTGYKERLALIVAHGIAGEIEVNGQEWNLVMPGHGHLPQLQGDGLADVLSYIRTAWANQADPVSKKDIRDILEAQKDRALPWTVTELEKLNFAK
ncbi:MAG: c-type cytochrome [Verrucomicrobiota bacterium]